MQIVPLSGNSYPKPQARPLSSNYLEGLPKFEDSLHLTNSQKVKFQGVKPSLLDYSSLQDFEHFKKTLEQGADIHKRKKHTAETALHSLFWEGIPNPDIKIFNYLIENGIDVNAKEAYGKTALHKLCEREIDSPDKLSMFKTLVSKTADLKDKDAFGLTILHTLASQKKPNLDAIRLIIDKVNVNEGTELGRTPLHSIMWNKEPNLEVVKLLLSNGADKNAKDTHGRAPQDIYKDLFPKETATLSKIHNVLDGKPTEPPVKPLKPQNNGFWGQIKSFLENIKSAIKSFILQFKSFISKK